MLFPARNVLRNNSLYAEEKRLHPNDRKGCRKSCGMCTLNTDSSDVLNVAVAISYVRRIGTVENKPLTRAIQDINSYGDTTKRGCCYTTTLRVPESWCIVCPELYLPIILARVIQEERKELKYRRVVVALEKINMLVHRCIAEKGEV